MTNLTTHLTGVHWVLANIPTEILFFSLFFICVGILHLGRWKFENLPYNISMASEIGDVALICAAMIAHKILNRPEGVNMWLEKSIWIVLFQLTSMCATWYGFNSSGEPQTKMDDFHNKIIAPLLALLLSASLPVVLVDGTKTEITSFFAFILVYAGFLRHDAKAGRLKQVKWFREELGIHLPLVRRKRK